MRAMKDSGIEWIGQVPESWESRSLKYALDAHSGGAWGSNESGDETDVICVRVADFDYSKLSVDFHDKMTVRSYTDKAVAESSLKYGDILLEKSGGGEVTPVGRSVLFTGEEGMMCANFIEWLRPNQHFNSCFLNYWLAAAYINGFSKRNVKQTTGIQNLDIPAFLSEKIAAPSVMEQKQIAQYLDAKCAEIDALIAAKEKTNALLRERRQSIIYEAVTKGLNPDAPMKDSGIEWIGQIPKHWDIMRAKFFAEITNGSDPKTEGDIPVYGSGSESFRTCGEFKEGPVVLLGRKGATLHIPHYVEGKYWNVDTAFDVRTNEDICLLKFYYYTSICFDYKLYVSTTTLPSMTQYNYGNMFIPIPSVVEQAEIVKHIEFKLRELDRAISDTEENIQKLKEYRQSVIYEAVTGKIEI